MKRILMVCLGNICRSPLAEGILKNKVLGTDVRVDSAGTAAYHIGKLPDSRSIAVAQKHGIDISDQNARQFVAADFQRFDMIFVMDQSNYDDVMSLASSDLDRSKVYRLLDRYGDGSLFDVPDPYYGGADGFQMVYDLLDQATERLVKDLK